MRIERLLSLSLLATVNLTPAILAAAVPERTAAGLTLEVSDDELESGMAYYVLTDDDSQLVVSSTTDLMRVSMTTSRIVGYLVAPFDLEEEEAGARPVLSGALRIPVSALRGGSSFVRGAVLGPEGLAAEEHPEIGVVFEGAREVRRLAGEAGDEVFRFAFTADVEVGLRGTTIPLSLPAVLTYRLSSSATLARYVGDMAVLTASFSLDAARLGIEVPPPLAPVLASTFELDLFLVLSTVRPDKSLDPRIPQELYEREQRFLVLLRDLDDDVAAYAHAESYARSVWEDAAPLGRLAYTIVAEPNIERRRLGFARRLAERAVELTGGSDPYLLNTLARIELESGDAAAALATQRRAVEALGEGDAQARSVFAENLERYEAAATH